jgi:hypothetical protein
LQADLTRIAVLFVATLFCPVTLRHTLPSEIEYVGFDGTVRDALPGLAGLSLGAISIVVALAGMYLRQDPAFDLEVSERRHQD